MFTILVTPQWYNYC